MIIYAKMANFQKFKGTVINETVIKNINTFKNKCNLSK